MIFGVAIPIAIFYCVLAIILLAFALFVLGNIAGTIITTLARNIIREIVRGMIVYQSRVVLDRGDTHEQEVDDTRVDSENTV